VLEITNKNREKFTTTFHYFSKKMGILARVLLRKTQILLWVEVYGGSTGKLVHMGPPGAKGHRWI
jgi:hypothetical protein